MIGGIVGFVLVAILIPLLVNEAGDLSRSLARCLCGGEPGASAGRTRPGVMKRNGWLIWSGFPAT